MDENRRSLKFWRALKQLGYISQAEFVAIGKWMLKERRNANRL